MSQICTREHNVPLLGTGGGNWPKTGFFLRRSLRREEVLHADGPLLEKNVPLQNEDEHRGASVKGSVLGWRRGLLEVP